MANKPDECFVSQGACINISCALALIAGSYFFLVIFPSWCKERQIRAEVGIVPSTCYVRVLRIPNGHSVNEIGKRVRLGSGTVVRRNGQTGAKVILPSPSCKVSSGVTVRLLWRKHKDWFPKPHWFDTWEFAADHDDWARTWIRQNGHRWDTPTCSTEQYLRLRLQQAGVTGGE